MGDIFFIIGLLWIFFGAAASTGHIGAIGEIEVILIVGTGFILSGLGGVMSRISKAIKNNIATIDNLRRSIERADMNAAQRQAGGQSVFDQIK